ncbi:hypothetical protein [Amycolatopsis palatopharyngis]|uniref:hypothetical protein n=1 Tax=Amycolatopsis palatopharyngis TaxID=187982 RepID=UPI000E2726E2|nr:hypothetical protein [Amycolatopsis palatopharyngis]
MLASKRAVVIATVSTVGLLGGSLPAFADDIYGNVNCAQTPSPACELSAGTGGTGSILEGEAGNDGTNPEHLDPPAGGNNHNGNSGDSIIGGESNLASCSYVPSDYQPPSGGTIPAGYTAPPEHDNAVTLPVMFVNSSMRLTTFASVAQEQTGSWYIWKCTSEGVADALYRPPVWMPDGEEPGAGTLPSPAELAQVAREQLQLPTPTISTSPSGDQLVNLPTWLWLSNGWDPTSATASVPGVSVTATATRNSVTWSMGDGSTVTCTGAGTPHKGGIDPKASSPDCGHVYRSSSASEPGQTFAVTATVHWTVTWSGAGQSGTFPDMTTTGNASLRVAESQALNNSGG